MKWPGGCEDIKENKKKERKKKKGKKNNCNISLSIWYPTGILRTPFHPSFSSSPTAETFREAAQPAGDARVTQWPAAPSSISSRAFEPHGNDAAFHAT